MKKYTLLLALFAILPFLSMSQISREPGRHHAKPTAKGVGKIDTRIDNMRYWRRMADSGFVLVAPMAPVPEAQYTGSVIRSPMVIPANSTDVPTTTVNSTQSENSVFVHPTNGQLVLNSNNSTQNPVGSLYGANYLISADGGTTWGGSVNGAGGSNSGDPAAAIGLTGRQYIGFIDNNDGQSVAYSTNNGTTWTTVAAAIQNGDLLDKNHLWIDNSASSPYEGNIYVSYTDFGDPDYAIEITRSTNDGLSYSTPVSISAAVNAGSHNQGVNIQTGPDGEVYVIWAIYDDFPADETAIGFAKSTNGGATFAPASRIISNIRGIRTSETSKNHRVNSFPSMAVDISGGPNNGNLYIVWANIGVPGTNTGSDIDVYMIKSTNEGADWSVPVKVNQDPSGQGKEHYFPWITCDRLTGELSVVFYDDRNVSSTQCEVFVANSADGGENWEDFKVSDVAFTPAPIPGLASDYMGDYLGISSVGNRVYPTWTDNRTGTTLTYVSPFNLSPAPAAFFAANSTSSCPDETVTLTDHSTHSPTSWIWSITPLTYTYVNSTGPNSQHPQVQFTDFGNYSIQLIAVNSYGSDTLLKTNYISVNDVNANFDANVLNINIGNSVTFTKVPSCNVTSYLWNFGNGASPATATTAGPHVVTYSTAGFKNVSLTINGTVTEIKNKYIIVDAAYCNAGATCDEYISNVTFGSISNSSSCTPGGYTKFTQYWTRVSPGIGYALTVTNGNPYTGNQCRTWVDWNQDLDFSDADEIYTMTGSPGQGPYTATITIPAGAAKGLTRIRTRITYTGSITACNTLQWGETEDYSIYVGTPGLWEGGTAGAETDWNTAGNWDDGRIPAASTNVVIPAGVMDYPDINGTITCNDLVIKDGATLTIGTGATLNVSGDLMVGEGLSGVFVIAGGICNVTGIVTSSPGSSIEVINNGVMNENE
jgi:PKD repeat protein